MHHMLFATILVYLEADCVPILFSICLLIWSIGLSTIVFMVKNISANEKIEQTVKEIEIEIDKEGQRKAWREEFRERKRERNERS